MSALTDRLRGVIGSAAGKGISRAGVSADSQDPDCGAGIDACEDGLQPAGGDSRTARRDSVAETLGGEWHEAGGHRFLVVDRKYTPGYRHGRVAVADIMPPVDGVWPHLDLLAGATPRRVEGAHASSSGRGLLFIDLETTGLAGGAGTYAFLVGCAWFDGALFRVRQLFLSSFGAEAAMLEEVATLASTAAGVVTYNGKSFDLPLLETRFALHRMQTRLADLPHVDMLHPARRLWKDMNVGEPGMESSCRLTALERSQCGFVREGDVPGFEIPSRYFDFVRRGDARPLEAVLEHNRLDLISLAMIAGRASQLIDRGPSSASTAREALGLGRMFESGGRDDEARQCYARAAGLQPGVHVGTDVTTRAEALKGYAVASRRVRAYADAAMAWTRALELRGCPSRIAREAAEALAVHHEHRLRDLGAAKAFALHSLAIETSRPRQLALEYRLARLDRKMGRERYPLFAYC